MHRLLEVLADCRKTGSAALGESVRKRRKNNIDKGSASMRFLIKARINKSNKFEKEKNNVFKYVGNR